MSGPGFYFVRATSPKVDIAPIPAGKRAVGC